MPEIKGVEKLISVLPRKRLGKPCLFGTAIFGWSEFGAEDIVIIPDRDEPINVSGIYRTDNVTGKTLHYKTAYHVPKNPRTGPQQAWRAQFKAGCVAWKALSAPEKAVYNEKAKGQNLYGVNLFLKQYLISL